MAAGQQAVSFNEIIKADRQKRKNEELANSILGKNRRTSAPGAGNNKAQNATQGSLASRIGVAKRSAPAPSKPKKAIRTPSAPARVTASNAKPGKKRRPDEDRLMSALNPASGQATVRDGPVGLSIKGAGSGPFVVVGSNFAPGTTAADIQSALEPITGNILRCWVTSQHPTVTAEVTFSEKWAAESAIANFHNQRADGRILSMRMKSTGAGSQGQDLFERSTGTKNSFNDLREQENRKRMLNRGADSAVQDGSYGFGGQNQATARRALTQLIRNHPNRSLVLKSSQRWSSTYETRQWSTPLARTLADAIKVTGPIPIAAFMRQVLTSPEGGYYTTRPAGDGEVFGKKGDFVTSPEISQVFGELVGIWTIAEWMAQGRKSSGVQLMEVGPGKGTLMDDMLRTFRNFKSFTSSIEAIYLVEASPTLREVQKQRLCGDATMEETEIGHKSTCKYFNVPVIWVEDIRLLPHEEDKSPFIIAHEFFDALPIHAFESVPPSPENQPPQSQDTIMTPTGPTKLHKPLKPANTPQWRELMVTLNPKAIDENLPNEPEFKLTHAKASTPSSLVIPEISPRYRALKSQPGSTIEISPESRIYASDFARRIGGASQPPRTKARNASTQPAAPAKRVPSGAALIMDYGTMDTIPVNSLRGIQHHRKVPPLSSPGQVDVSADVDFTALAEAALEGSEGVEVHGPVEQGDFLRTMGIAERMQQLLKHEKDEEKRKTLESGWQRLVEKGGGGMGKIYKFMAIVPENEGKRRPVGFGGGIEL
ncbi:S-adenosyl-L-methionine-dependent methyltransferase [Aspergillus flavus]|uniref:type II protein arginine methyltransferase n=1 Tax=Aspergillus flavus (strain ATCC 200026 / FGSC A1120 / IAM 13836 / NRRL 3357 / JCM 12722 / SRRC 167) TaxID=332952 RepID=A0A7U2R0U7_ASPFN|nr:S-adenosyl-L-methionine-dependent methyltransferase [Aspergillus flavus]